MPIVVERLTRCGADDEIEAHRVGERAKIAVAGEQRDSAVDTALGDQSIAEARLTPPFQHRRP